MQKTIINKKFQIWNGIFNNFEDASKNQLYNIRKYNKLYIKLALRVFKKNKLLLSKKKIDRLSVERFIHLPILVSNLPKKNRINILDFGGGFGNSYLYLKLTLEKKLFNKINYNIIETEDVSAAGKKINNKVNFYTNLNFKFKPDIIFFCSSLQYIDDWKTLINKICKLQPKQILISDLFCHENFEFITHQNYYNYKLPHRFYSLRKLNLEFRRNKYHLNFMDNVLVSRLGKYNYLPMKNFPNKYRIKYTKHLLYEKK